MYFLLLILERRSQWPRGLTCGFAVARLLGSLARIPLEGMSICLLRVLCVVRQRSLRRTNHSSRGVPLSVVLLCVVVNTRQ